MVRRQTFGRGGTKLSDTGRAGSGGSSSSSSSSSGGGAGSGGEYVSDQYGNLVKVGAGSGSAIGSRDVTSSGGKGSISTPRKQTYGRGGVKLSDTSRVQVKDPSGGTKWIPLNKAKGTLAYAEAQKKLEVQQGQEAMLRDRLKSEQAQRQSARQPSQEFTREEPISTMKAGRKDEGITLQSQMFPVGTTETTSTRTGGTELFSTAYGVSLPQKQRQTIVPKEESKPTVSTSLENVFMKFGTPAQKQTFKLYKGGTELALGKTEAETEQRRETLITTGTTLGSLALSGGIVVKTAGAVGKIPAVANLISKGGAARYVGLGIKSVAGGLTAYGATYLQQPILEPILVTPKEREFLAQPGGREQAQELIMVGRQAKAKAGRITLAEAYERKGVIGVGGEIGASALTGVFPGFKSDESFLVAAEQRAKELGYAEPERAAKAALRLEEVEEVKFTQRVIIPEIAANVFGAGLDIGFKGASAFTRRAGPGVLEGSLASYALLERTPYTETTIAGQPITLEKGFFFMKKPKQGAKEELQLAQQTYETKQKEYEGLISIYPKEEGKVKVPEEQFAFVEKKRLGVESAIKNFTREQEEYKQEGKLRFGSLAIVPTVAVLGGVSATAFAGFENFVKARLPKAGPKVSTTLGYTIDFPEEIIGDIFTPGESVNVPTFTKTLSDVGGISFKGPSSKPEEPLPLFIPSNVIDVTADVSDTWSIGKGKVTKVQAQPQTTLPALTDTKALSYSISNVPSVAPTTDTYSIAPISNVPSIAPITDITTVAPQTDLAVVSPISNVPSIAPTTDTFNVAPTSDVSSLVFTPKLFPFFPPLGFLSGEGTGRRKTKKGRASRYTPDFIATILNQFGPAPAEGTIFSGQERRYKVRDINQSTRPILNQPSSNFNLNFGFNAFGTMPKRKKGKRFNSLSNVNRLLGG